MSPARIPSMFRRLGEPGPAQPRAERREEESGLHTLSKRGERETGPALSEAERARRESVARTVQTAAELDREFFTHVVSARGELAANIERIDTLETLGVGADVTRENVQKEILNLIVRREHVSRAPASEEKTIELAALQRGIARYERLLERPSDEIGRLGDDSVNAVYRREYKGDPPRTAFVKPRSGETYFRMNEATGRVDRIQQRLNEVTQEMEEVILPLDPSEEEGVRVVMFEGRQRLGGVVDKVAAFYGIEPAEVPLDDKIGTSRHGLECQSSPFHEYVVSRIAELTGLGSVPLTCLRAERGNADIASVQEKVASVDPEHQARPVDKETYIALRDLGPKHPGAVSFMRLACLDYLVGSMDRHPDNIFYDPVSHAFTGIDNAASFGLSMAMRQTDAQGRETTVEKPLDMLVSLPLEMVDRHQDWQLDDAAFAELTRLYGSMTSYLARRESRVRQEGSSLDENVFARADDGKEIKYLTKLFRFMFRNEKIASKEALEFTRRLGELLRYRRPPHSKIVGRLNTLADKWPPFQD